MIQELNAKYTQNFLKNRSVLERILTDLTSISDKDIVLEIGTGKGFITRSLARRAKQVITYEIDPELLKRTSELFKYDRVENVIFLNQDFLDANLQNSPAVKIFANIPFFITSKIVRKIIFSRSKIKEAYLFMDKEAYLRYQGLPARKETLFSIVFKHLFESKLIYSFKGFDFEPVPNVDVVLIKMIRKNFLDFETQKFFDFVAYIFNLRKANIKNSLLGIFTFTQVQKIKNQMKLSWDESVSDLNYEEWLAIFELAKKYARTDIMEKTSGCFRQLENNYFKQNKSRKVSV